jgi:hypothetical protein
LGVHPLHEVLIDLDQENYACVDVVVQNDVKEFSKSYVLEWCSEHSVAKLSHFFVSKKELNELNDAITDN